MANVLWEMMYDDWRGLIRTVFVGTLAYVGLVVMLRTSGKRTLSQMNAFDFVVTVALGSTLATVLLTKDVALFEGLLGFATLIALQYAVAWSSVRSRRFNSLVKGRPALLFYRGEFLRDAMRRERVSEDEVRSAVRENRFASLDRVEAVVLETAGTFSVLRLAEPGEPANALHGVRDDPHHASVSP